MAAHTIHASSQEAFVQQGVEWLRTRIIESIRDRGRCTLALSGGSTPKDIYAGLAKVAGVDWSRVTLLLVDERHVPAGHPDANVTLLAGAGLLSLGARLLAPRADLPPDAAAGDYGARVRDALPADVMTLGLGDDGHIASLFPPVATALLTSDAVAVHTTTDKFATRDRLSLTLHNVSSARAAIFFLKGDAKMKVWHEMLASSLNVSRWPAHQVLAHCRTTLLYV